MRKTLGWNQSQLHIHQDRWCRFWMSVVSAALHDCFCTKAVQIGKVFSLLYGWSLQLVETSAKIQVVSTQRHVLILHRDRTTTGGQISFFFTVSVEPVFTLFLKLHSVVDQSFKSMVIFKGSWKLWRAQFCSIKQYLVPQFTKWSVESFQLQCGYGSRVRGALSQSWAKVYSDTVAWWP